MYAFLCYGTSHISSKDISKFKIHYDLCDITSSGLVNKIRSKVL
jgi:hypothetical protein